MCAPLKGEERAGVAPAKQEEQEAVQQGQGEPEQEEEEEPRAAHEQGVAVSLFFLFGNLLDLGWVRMVHRLPSPTPARLAAYPFITHTPSTPTIYKLTCACLPLATM